ncbi:MAG: PIN/TRAM domain-containing protein [Phycisphaera sp.]|nr:PIN/TRAM domain-containing protein [Phycisphaera sp.]
MPFQEDEHLEFGKVVALVGAAIGVSMAIVVADIFVRQKRLSALSGIFIGLIAGLLAAYALSFVVDLFGVIVPPPHDITPESYLTLLKGVKVLIGLITCYLGISLVIQTKDDFRFVVPYVEFAREIRGTRPTIIDTSIIIDGRILDIAQTHVLQGEMIVPRFVVNELQLLADSPDKIKRSRGRRGLDILNKLVDDPSVSVTIQDLEAEGGTVDQKLVSLGQKLRARVMTNDFNLGKVATLRNVEIINLNELAKTLRPVALPGELMHVKIVKAGEGPGQGVGYLEDGTMVVVEGGRAIIGHDSPVSVTSTIQTSAGRMIFAKVSEG